AKLADGAEGRNRQFCEMRPEILFPLFAPTTVLKGVGPRLAALIERAAGPSVIDLCWTLPAGLIDRSLRPKTAEAREGVVATFEVTVDEHQPAANRRAPYRVRCSDDTGFLTLVFFRHQEAYLKDALPVGARRLVSGKAERYQGQLQMTHPDYIVDPDEADELPAIEPVYPLTAGLTAKVMGRAVRGALARAPALDEWQDGAWRARRGWPTWRDALIEAHGPQSPADLNADSPARARLAYDELLANQLALALVRQKRKAAKGRAQPVNPDSRARALAALPFELTAAQAGALAEIDADMAAPLQMVRLLQGDVGSGKTVVALLAAATAAGAAWQPEARAARLPQAERMRSP
ncbi:MAG: OB-fold nucleic acid binding domain-containing protein, partial [Pseudomonadota bacterium]